MFTTYWFVSTSLAFLVVYWLARKPAVRYWLLLLYCCLFHAHFAGPAGVLPIVCVGLLVYAVGLSKQRWLCCVGIVVAVSALLAYKYRDFLVQTVVVPLAPALAGPLQAFCDGVCPAVTPLAISFFTFEFVHYLVEVLRGRPPIQRLTDFAAFALFFPTLIAGPIKRYEDFLPALKAGVASVTTSDVCVGTLRVTVGFLKKLLLADNLTRYVNYQCDHFSELSLMVRWLVVYGVFLCVYLDFSAYSDMAIGYARLMGIRVPENFNWPIVAQNMKEFWQRWHISLSTWIRDYIYIPCGGSRLGVVRQAVNGMLAFLIMGLWHGAALNFVVMGAFFGVALAINVSYRRALGPVGRLLGLAFDRCKPLAWAVNWSALLLAFLLFKYPIERVVRISGLLFAPGG